MKYVLALAAMFALIGFVSPAHAADPKPKPAHFVKVDGMVVTYIGGAKGKGKEATVTIDASTKITVDGKDAKITDIKADEYIEITMPKGAKTPTLIAASSTMPTPTTAPAKK